LFKPVDKSSTCCSHVVSMGHSHVVSIGSTKGIGWDFSLLVTSVSFSTISRVLKSSKAWVILSIKVTSMPTPIFCITNGIGFGARGFPKLMLEC